MKLEFYGPPGCGKTYILEKLTGVDRTQIRKEATSETLQILKKLSKLTPYSIYYKLKLKRLLKNAVLQPLYHETDLDTMIDSIVLVATSYRINLKSKKVLDEGLIQRIISLSINYNISDESTLEIIKFFKPLLTHVKVVSIYLSQEDLLKSIKLRNRKESKMDFLEETVLEDFIQKYVRLCRIVTQNFHFEEITREDFDLFIERNN